MSHVMFNQHVCIANTTYCLEATINLHPEKKIDDIRLTEVHDMEDADGTINETYFSLLYLDVINLNKMFKNLVETLEFYGVEK